MLNEQAKHIAYIIKNGIDNKVTRIEVSAEAEKQWVDTML